MYNFQLGDIAEEINTIFTKVDTQIREIIGQQFLSIVGIIFGGLVVTRTHKAGYGGGGGRQEGYRWMMEGTTWTPLLYIK